MPTFSQSLEQSLHRALAIANERHHQYATLEHLLLSLIDDSDAAAVMRACSVDLDKLRTSLVNYLETEFENLVTDGQQRYFFAPASTCPPNFCRIAESIFSANVCCCRERNRTYNAAVKTSAGTASSTAA